MIISKLTGRKLVKSGKAKVETVVVMDNQRYAAITRFDNQRTDHYPINETENN